MSVADGIDCFRTGLQLVRRQRLRPYVWLPIVVSLVVVTGLMGLVMSQIDDLVNWIVSKVPDWLAFVDTILAPLFYLITFFAGGWLVGLVAIIIASPFLGGLSAGAEREQFGRGPDLPAASVASFGREVALALRRELRKLGYSLPRLIAVFLISLIPLISPFAPIIWFFFGAWVMAIQFVDYAPENRGLDFRETLAVLRANRSRAVGFGAVAATLMAIPFLNVFVIPVAVCGGAVLWRNMTD